VEISVYPNAIPSLPFFSVATTWAGCLLTGTPYERRRPAVMSIGPE
jgi:hypothetical protein